MNARFPITNPSLMRAPFRLQALVLARAVTTLVAPVDGAALASTEVRLSGDVIKVTASPGNDTIKLPPPAAVVVTFAAQPFKIWCAAASTVPLIIQSSAGVAIVTVMPGGWARFVQVPTDGPILESSSTPSPAASPPAATQKLYAPLGMSVTIASGAGNTDIPGTEIPRALRITRAQFVSDGATGGTIQLQTAAGAANITNAMVPGNAGVLTQPTALANASLAAGAGLRVAAGAGNPGGTLDLFFQPA